MNLCDYTRLLSYLVNKALLLQIILPMDGTETLYLFSLAF